MDAESIIARSMLNRATALLAFAIAFVTGGGVLPANAQQVDPASLPAHDSHQGVLVAANPYISAERYKARFGKHTPYEAGVLALEVYFRNDNDMPIRLNLNTVRLLIGPPGDSRQRLEPSSPEEVADQVLTKAPKDPTQRRFPQIPGVGPKIGKDKNWEEFAGILRSAAVSSDVIAPHSTLHGFFYFDIDHHYPWLSNARFYVPDLAFMAGNKALFFFEVDLAPAVP